MLKCVTAAAFGLAALLSSSAALAAPPYGVWTSQERDVRVRLADCGGKICGTLVWLQEPLDPKTGRPKTDRRNPDPAKRARPLIGLRVVKDFVPSGRQKWTGTIYNADNGHTYRAHLILRGPRTARLEGCMLVVLCMGHTWHRVDSETATSAGALRVDARHSADLRVAMRGPLWR